MGFPAVTLNKRIKKNDSIVIKLGQDACLGNCWDNFEHGLSGMKN
jgi:hypothetical protein